MIFDARFPESAGGRWDPDLNKLAETLVSPFYQG